VLFRSFYGIQWSISRSRNFTWKYFSKIKIIRIQKESFVYFEQLNEAQIQMFVDDLRNCFTRRIDKKAETTADKVIRYKPLHFL